MALCTKSEERVTIKKHLTLIMSIVAIAKPAPFTMQPMLPAYY